MQLKRIQLNGFKSFVDPTSISVLSRMNAIVGPNGCGKSNIVDAIRWVTGETSAKQLRGQSMSDVIFNGTTGRKPLGKASVELTFDNTDRKIAGEYAAFSEISIRREVVREDQSAYFINGVPARRKDLVDLFLGTGLGPRSYAIIEQGMIAQLVEAKPEDMRVHLEEVAGISKYRERRRETENRIRHTQENLDRLNDVREELEKQLRHLERQSQSAEKYKVLQAELRLLHAQIKVLQWKSFENQLGDKKEKINQQANEYEAHVAQLRECEKHVEQSRIASQNYLDQKNEIQKQFYGIGADVAKLEQQIQYKQEQLTQWKNELQQSGAFFEELTTQASEQQKQMALLTDEIAILKPQANTVQQALNQANHVLADAEKNMRESQNAWDDFHNQTAQTAQQLEVAKNNVRHYETQKKQLSDRHAQLESQLQAMSLRNLTNELSPLTEKSTQLKNTITDIQKSLVKLSESITSQRAHYQTAQNALLQVLGELQKQEAQYASLRALQEATLQDRQTDEVRPWLEKQGLKNAPQLGKMLHVEAGWELAVETIMGSCFDAICVNAIDVVAQSLPDASHLMLLQAEKKSAPRLPEKTLSDVIGECPNLPAWVSGIYIAETLLDALTLRGKLSPTESVITKTGQWMGANWLQLTRATAAEDGFLVREKKLKELQKNITVQKQTVASLEIAQQTAKIELEKLESARDTQHRLFQETTQVSSNAQAELSAKQSRLDTLSLQQQRLQLDIQNIQLQQQQCETQLRATQDAIRLQSDAKNHEDVLREKLLSARAIAENKLSDARDQWQSKKQQADERHIRLTSAEKQFAVLMQSQHANQKQLTQLTERRHTLQQQLSTVNAPLAAWQAALQLQLAERVATERKLLDADAQVQTEQNKLRELELRRDRLSKDIAALQDYQQQCKLAIQEIVVRQMTLREQLSEMQFELENILRGLPKEAELSEWENRTNQWQAKIDRLGPINLAAIDEFTALNERKTYLDKQVVDLMEALEILQNAIRKIDRETRHLFKDTFDKLNQHFQALFPRIFDGGQASLGLTEDDLLTTGVLIRAQPPGKRNATIHLLSGGEKALTAIALMFAMFQLNPAPFCVLDEVDAPLDDLNVGRYCQLVREMSKDTQFLIISHNKVTIEMADHLMGVTMQEPGVSRIVSVDIQEAVAMAG